MPLVSVVVAVFNGAAWLEACLASILAQCAEAVRIAGVMLDPFLHEKTAQLRAALGGGGGGGAISSR